MAEINPRFRELILYVAAKSKGDPSFGSTKLNKVLFFCDFLAHRSFGRSISGETYQKLPYGPAPRALKPTIQAMTSAGDCLEVERTHFGLQQRKLIPRRDADLSHFTPQEVDLINEVIVSLWTSSATSVSELSHGFVGWKMAEVGEDIPYSTIFVGDAEQPLTDEETEYGQQIWREYAGTLSEGDSREQIPEGAERARHER